MVKSRGAGGVGGSMGSRSRNSNRVNSGGDGAKGEEPRHGQASAEAERLARSRARQFRLIAGGISLLALLLLLQAFRGPRPVSDPGVEVRVNMAGFKPVTIEARAGEPVTITLVNEDNEHHVDGGGWHNFVLEDLGVSERVKPLGTYSFKVTADKPGEYPFYCDICCGGKENPTMWGRLVVT